MLNINLKARLKNKTFWISIISAILLLTQQLGFDASRIIPGNYVEIINTLFVILTMLGITVDTSTSGISDQTIFNNLVGQEISIKGNKESSEITELSKEINNKDICSKNQDQTGAIKEGNTILTDNKESKSLVNKSNTTNTDLLTINGNDTIIADTSTDSEITTDNPANLTSVGVEINSMNLGK